MNKRFLCLLGVGVLGTAGAARAVTISYPDFSSTAGLTLNGDAAQVGNDLRLTAPSFNESGSAFSTSAMALNNQNSFSTRFQFQITDSGGIGDQDGAGADGIVFVVQTVSNSVGGAGGGIGYQGIPNSVGIEFDTYNNGAQDDSLGNHVGIDLNGSVSSAVLTSVSPRFNDGNIWTGWVDYNGPLNLLEVRVNQTGIRPVLPTLTYSADLSAVLGAANAFVGFTAGTGSGWGDQRILSWEFEDDFNPIDVTVPEAGSTLLLLGAGLAGIVSSCRRRGC